MFEQLSDRIKEQGDTKNSVLDIERKLEQLSEKGTSKISEIDLNSLNNTAGDLDVERVETDLKQMREENEALLERLRSGKSDPLSQWIPLLWSGNRKEV